MSVDLNKHYSWRGIAVTIAGYVQEERTQDGELICDLEFCIHDRPECWTEDEFFVADNTDRVRVVMVGDNREHEVDASDLKALLEDEFCRGCGQVGCAWHENA